MPYGHCMQDLMVVCCVKLYITSIDIHNNIEVEIEIT